MQVETLRTSSGQLIDGPLLLTPRVYADDRGYFFESWNQRIFADALGIGIEQVPLFYQDNQSHSIRGVLRGLHYQLEPEPQGKLVRCVSGEIFDVIVDIRLNSPSFASWLGVKLTEKNHAQLWVPVGFAHGFLTLSESATVLYKATGFWSKECERSLIWNDSTLAIDWPLTELDGHELLLAGKDAAAPTLNEAVARHDVFP